MSVSTDGLSPLARQILKIEPARAFENLVVSGDGNTEARALLKSATIEQLVFAPIHDADSARLVHAALWLWHDWLDESHQICQSVDTHEGAFWHAIMHRREGDFSNSKYWYAKCDGHPLFATISGTAQALINPWPADKMLLKLNYSSWSPSAFVDFVEYTHTHPTDERKSLAVALQQLEWRTLFDHCVRTARAASKN